MGTHKQQTATNVEILREGPLTKPCLTLYITLVDLVEELPIPRPPPFFTIQFVLQQVEEWFFDSCL